MNVRGMHVRTGEADTRGIDSCSKQSNRHGSDASGCDEELS